MGQSLFSLLLVDMEETIKIGSLTANAGVDEKYRRNDAPGCPGYKLF